MSRFVGFVKKEISTRVGAKDNRTGPKWDSRFEDAALPIDESLLGSFKYCLAHRVKEDLVLRPQDWPGANAASHLMYGRPMKGFWFDGTGYSKARHNALALLNPTPVKKVEYITPMELQLAPLPFWEHLEEKERQKEVQKLAQ